MPLAKLGADVEVQEKKGPTGTFYTLRNPRSSKSLTLNQNQYLLVQLLAEANTYQDLVTAAINLGVAISESAAAKLVEGLRKTSMLDEPSPAPARAAPAASSAWQSPERPKLRGDLDVQRTATGPATLYEVRVPGSPSICTLYEVDLTAARLMDGTRDLDAIARSGTAAGLPMTRQQIEKFIRQLAAYNLIEDAAPMASASPTARAPGTVLAPPDGNEAPQPFARTVIGGAEWQGPERPKLKSNLETKKVVRGKSTLYELREPGATAVCTVYDVELTVARFMDGRRDLQEICVGGKAAGIPMTVPALEKFVRQLAAYRLIENAEPLPPLFTAASGDVVVVKPGDEDVTLPRSSGPLPAAAASASDSDSEPTLPGPSRPAPRPVGVPSAATAGEPGAGMAGAVSAAVEAAREPDAVTQVARDTGPPLDAPSPGPATRVGAAAPRWALAVGIAVFAAGASLAALAFIRLPTRAVVGCTVEALDAKPVLAPLDGTVADVPVVAGQSVNAGDLLARLDDTAARPELSKQTEALRRAEADLAVLKTFKPADLATAKRRVEAAQKNLAAAKKLAAAFAAAAKKKKALAPKLEAAKAGVTRRQADLDKALAALEPLKAAGMPGALKQRQAEVKALRAAKAKADQAVRAHEIRAPAAGIVATARPESRLGVAVHAGEAVLALSTGGRLGVRLALPARDADLAVAGAPVTLRLAPGANPSATGKVVGATASAGSKTIDVTVEFDAKYGALKPGTAGEAEIDGGRRPLFRVLARRLGGSG